VNRLNAAEAFGRADSIQLLLFYSTYALQLHDRSPAGVDLDALLYQDLGTFSGTDGIFPNERRVHASADSDMAPHLMVSELLPARGLDGLAGIRGSSVRPRKDPVPEKILALDAWRRHWTVTTGREYLGEGEMESKLAVIRQRTHTERPLGTVEFIQHLEKATQRELALQKRGPREKIVTDQRQRQLTFDP
jgi:hypothetical protein